MNGASESARTPVVLSGTVSQTPRGTLELIQVFRGAAAIMVMLYHVTMVNHFYANFLNNFFGFGHSGVDFFFVLSGFIILYVHYDQASHPRKVGRFLALRAVRIFPIYWCVLAATVICFAVFGQTDALIWAPTSTLSHSTIARAILLYDQETDGIVPVAWTLSYEIIFYVFFSLYILCGARIFALVALAWCGAIAVQWSAWAYLGSYRILLRPVVVEFFLGCLAAVLVKRSRYISGWWVILAIGLCAVVARAELVGAIDGYKWYAVPYFLLILTGGAYDQASARSYARPLLLLGEASYSIYLVHYGMIILFSATVDPYRSLASEAPTLTLMLLILAIVTGSVLVHRYIERPLLSRARLMLAP